MPTSFENFVNNELPRRIAYLGGTLPAGQRLKTSGSGLLVEIDTDVVMVFKGYEETGTYPVDPKDGDVWLLGVTGDLGTLGDSVMYYDGNWIQLGGGGTANLLDYVDVTGPSTITGTANKSYFCDTTSGSIVISLPSEILEDEFIEVTLKTMGEGNELTVDPAGATIEDTTEVVLIDLENTTFRFIKRNTKWFIIANGVALEPITPAPSASTLVTVWESFKDYSGFADNDLPDIVYHPGDEDTGTIPGLYFSIADHEGTEFFEYGNWRSVSNAKFGFGTQDSPNSYQHPVHDGDLVLVGNYWDSYLAFLRGRDLEGSEKNIAIRSGTGAVIAVFAEPLETGTPNTFTNYNKARPTSGDIVFYKDETGFTHFYYVQSDSYSVDDDVIEYTWNYEEITLAHKYETVKNISVGTTGDYPDILTAMAAMSNSSGQTLMVELLEDIDLPATGAIQFPTFVMVVFTTNNHTIGSNVLSLVGGSMYNVIDGTVTFAAKTTVSNLTIAPMPTTTELIANNGVLLEACVLDSITLTKGSSGAQGEFDLSNGCRFDTTILNDARIINVGGSNSIGNVSVNLTNDLATTLFFASNGSSLGIGTIEINGAYDVIEVFGISGATIYASTITLTGGATYTAIDNTPAAHDGKIYDGRPDATVECIPVACSDETTALTAGTGKVTFRMPYAFTLQEVRASLSTAQTSGSIFTVDVNKSGASVFSTTLTIDNTEKTSATATTAAYISDTALADDAEITIDIDQIGDGTAKGLKVYLIGVKA